MNKLDKLRRDELACNYVTHEVCFNGLEYPLSGKTYKNCVQSYKSGFNAAVAELMPEVEKMVAALEFECGNRCAHQNPCNAREVLTNFKAFMGDGE